MSQMSQQNTLCFTTEQGNSIIMKDSLFTTDAQPIASEKQFSQEDLRKLLEKDKRLELHAITLSDYWRQEMIPRGLRIHKFPSFGKDNPDFKTKWEAILNKCSLDLMLLLIDEAKTQRDVIRHQIQEVRTAVVSNLAKEQTTTETTLDNSLREHIQELSQALTRVKLNKFRRDEQDYKDGTVYSWQKRSRPPARRSRGSCGPAKSKGKTRRGRSRRKARDGLSTTTQAPTTNTSEETVINISEVDLYRFYRNLHLKAWYHNQPSLDTSTSNTSNTQGEKEALKWLKDKDDIIIKKADKGGATVVWGQVIQTNKGHSYGHGICSKLRWTLFRIVGRTALRTNFKSFIIISTTSIQILN
ncbi:hypothetical protein WMY93_015103 [Mugilogobius chulae]|uniref:Uncharacterized protein n=1 Tax=Mugilogobius chulae TaxID=88201 RepID=A0AAW0NX87_9GOBI